MNDGDPLFGQALRQPPQNQAAEQSVLGALLASNRAYEMVQDFLRPEHFADPINGRIYDAIARRIEAGQLADIVTLRAQFEHSGELAEVGGAAYLAQLLSAMVGIINAGEYGRVIRDAWLRRALIGVGEDMVNAAYGEHGAAEVLGKAEENLFALGEAAADRGGSADLLLSRDVAQQVLHQLERARLSGNGLTGITTGYLAIDRATRGLGAGDFILLAGRPSMGKTALATGIALRTAAHLRAQKKPEEQGDVLFVSAEMHPIGVSARGQAAAADIPLEAVLSGKIIDPGANVLRDFTQAEFDKLFEVSGRIGDLPLHWYKASSPTVAHIRAVARRLHRRRRLRLIVVDYIGRMRASEGAQRQGKVIEVTEISAGLKALAYELGVPVMALSQLSREVEKREDKTPQLSDLRDSGALEQDADVIIFVYREHYYLTRNPPQRREKESAEQFEVRQDAWLKRIDETRGMAEAIIGKQRQGPTGRVPLRFHDRTTWFRDMSEDVLDPAIPGL